VLLACGVFSPLLYAVSDWLAGSRWAGYSFRDMTISELGAIGAPTRAFFSGLVLAVYALLFAFGVGIWRTAGTKVTLRVVGGLVIGLGVMAWVTMPFGATDLRTEGLSPATTIHIILTALGALTVITAMAFGAAAFGPRFRLYSIATIAVMVAFAAWSGLSAARPEEDLVTPWLGVKERISFYSYQLWFAVLAVMLLRDSGWTAKRIGRSRMAINSSLT
jgi:hypothetical protein